MFGFGRRYAAAGKRCEASTDAHVKRCGKRLRLGASWIVPRQDAVRRIAPST